MSIGQCNSGLRLPPAAMRGLPVEEAEKKEDENLAFLSRVLDQCMRKPPALGSLQHLAAKELCPRFLPKWLKDPTTTNMDLARKLYTVAMPKDQQQQKIKQIKDRAINFLKNKIAHIDLMPDHEVQKFKETLLPNGAFINETVSELYKQGFSSESWRLPDGFADTAFYESLYETVYKDFQDGVPLSFPMISSWIGKESIFSCFSLLKHPFFEQSTNALLSILKKLASLGVEEAQHALYRTCKFNSLGLNMDFDRPLNWSVEERVKVLASLSEMGHSQSQYELANVYFYNKINSNCETHFSDEERERGIHRLMEIESNESNPQISKIYSENRTGGVPCRYSFEDRIHHLTKRARAGDRISFQVLWHLYSSNKSHFWEGYILNDKEIIPLKLTEEERWEKLNELKTPASEHLFNQYYTHWVIHQTDLLPSHLTAEKRLSWLENEAFIKQSGHADFYLSSIYQRNCLGDARLGIPLKDRLEKLEALARLGNYSALRHLQDYYLPDYTDEHRERIAHDRDSDEPDYSPLSAEENAMHLWKIAFEGEHWKFMKDHLVRHFKTSSQGAIELALNHLTLLKNSFI